MNEILKQKINTARNQEVTTPIEPQSNSVFTRERSQVSENHEADTTAHRESPNANLWQQLLEMKKRAEVAVNETVHAKQHATLTAAQEAGVMVTVQEQKKLQQVREDADRAKDRLALAAAELREKYGTDVTPAFVQEEQGIVSERPTLIPELKQDTVQDVALEPRSQDALPEIEIDDFTEEMGDFTHPSIDTLREWGDAEGEDVQLYAQEQYVVPEYSISPLLTSVNEKRRALLAAEKAFAQAKKSLLTKALKFLVRDTPTSLKAAEMDVDIAQDAYNQSIYRLKGFFVSMQYAKTSQEIRRYVASSTEVTALARELLHYQLDELQEGVYQNQHSQEYRALLNEKIDYNTLTERTNHPVDWRSIEVHFAERMRQVQDTMLQYIQERLEEDRKKIGLTT